MTTTTKMEPTRFRAPTSGQVLGALARLLDETPAVLRSKQAQRFFAGEIVSPKQRRKIYDALSNAILEDDLFPHYALQGLVITANEILASIIAWQAERWDRLVATTYSHSGRVYDTKDAVLAYLRLVVVDMAVRGIALLWLIDEPEPGEGIPTWAKENGVAHSLRQLLAKAGFTRHSFTETLDVSERTVDNWLDGLARPTSTYYLKSA